MDSDSDNHQTVDVHVDDLHDKGNEALEPEPEDSCTDLAQSTSSPVELQLLPEIKYEC